MIIRENINGLIFVEQRTYYVYASEEDFQNDKKTLVTSSEGNFNINKEIARKKEEAGDPNNKFFVF